jgi:hypothetical protein
MRRGEHANYRITFDYPERGVTGTKVAHDLWHALYLVIPILERGAVVTIDCRNPDRSWNTGSNLTANDLDVVRRAEQYLL